MTWTNEIEKYRQAFSAAQPTMAERTIIAEQFGDNPDLADKLGKLIRDGIKTATCSALWGMEARNDSLPEVGLLTIVLDGNNEPLCIIETTEVNIIPYHEVDSRFARDEGEGDRYLEYWRRVHWDYFTRVLQQIGKKPSWHMPLVCERFRVVYI